MKVFHVIIIFLVFYGSSVAMDLEKVIDLKGEWRIEIGDNQDFARPNFNDSNWEKIQVPSRWEDQGFPGYDGYAWYRISFKAPHKMQTDHLYLKLGRIDDVDRVYLNGVFIGGRGVLPPNYRTAYNIKRCYPLPEGIIKPGRINVLAVKVYDKHGAGGIYKGNIGIYSRKDYVNLSIDLSGKWIFSAGDFSKNSSPVLNTKKWKNILVPARWEDEGYPDLDGFAWYRKRVVIKSSLASSKLILMLGKINDIDAVYFNGTLIGSTGNFNVKDLKKENLAGEYYKKERAYFIPPTLIKANRENLIAVRIFDFGNKGGIYEGDVGIVTRDEYLRHQQRKD
ncbi:beta galactosidase jelly roll domain-containing protein [candidate division KSB1 bacterium]|nr:beta galactosidase jelly roll domain-containing protein [candidate division KSB1 bacterium]MBL7092721.1 beta galactosidase jelly roll domain-containing protein [candidate division KSB1 bacterium]